MSHVRSAVEAAAQALRFAHNKADGDTKAAIGEALDATDRALESLPAAKRRNQPSPA